MTVLLYGVTGYTGRLVSRALAERGVAHVVAGRRKDAVEAWGRAVGAPARTFDVDHAELRGVTAILNCAGPFARTSGPLVRAAIAAGVHYLDLAGEVAAHASVHDYGDEAAARGVMLMPGVGFGVVPTECAAALAVAALPTAKRLVIAYETVGKASRGTLETVLSDLGAPGVVRRAGELRPSLPAERVLDLDLGGGTVRVATNPYRADLLSAFLSTGVADIETYATFPAPLRLLMRSRFARCPSVQRSVDALVARAPDGPSDADRARGRTRILVVAEDGPRRATVRVTGPDAYEFTARAACAVAARIDEAVPGFRTPSQVFGADLLRAIVPGPDEGVEVSS